jgi:glycine dehydrogenase subunit 1
LICQLTGLDVSNASLYDGGSAVTEAALMCVGVNKRQKVVVPDTVHPEYRQILATYLENLDTELVVLETTAGVASPESIQVAVDDRTACLILQNPNFFGCVEAVQQIADIVHAAGALLVVSFDPISVGRLRRPGDMGADIAVAEGQSLGSPMAYGGPYLGILACREDFVRRIPGRIAGQTVDRRGNRCWVLTLQTREQHIRRDKATSNICTNQGLFALRASIYLALLGPRGLQETADLCLQKSHYAAAKMTESDRFELAWANPFGKEFVIRDLDNKVEALLAHARRRRILAGLPLGKWYPQLKDCFLVAVTEQRTRQQIDQLAHCLSTCNDTETVHA